VISCIIFTYIFIFLQTPGYATGYMGVNYDCSSSGWPKNLKTCGYPGNKPSGTQWCADTCKLYYTPGTSCVYSNGETDQPCMTYSGQSGSPIYDPATNGIHGVLSGG
jgi:V8-like Glu-specific endopeptidase